MASLSFMARQHSHRFGSPIAAKYLIGRRFVFSWAW